jgi:hypothetical protein
VAFGLSIAATWLHGGWTRPPAVLRSWKKAHTTARSSVVLLRDRDQGTPKRAVVLVITFLLPKGQGLRGPKKRNPKGQAGTQHPRTFLNPARQRGRQAVCVPKRNSRRAGSC